MNMTILKRKEERVREKAGITIAQCLGRTSVGMFVCLGQPSLLFLFSLHFPFFLIYKRGKREKA
jgi:hypothetical protein